MRVVWDDEWLHCGYLLLHFCFVVADGASDRQNGSVVLCNEAFFIHERI